MSLSDIAAIGSLASGMAVLGSLVFLYFQMKQMSEQVRQTERNQRAIMNQGTIDRIAESMRFFSEPHISSLLSRVQSGETNLSAAELSQLRFCMRINLVSLQDTLLQHGMGLIDQITYDNGVRASAVMLTMPAFRALWQVDHAAYADEMAAHVDRLIAEKPPAAPIDIVALFKANLATIAPKEKIT